MPKKPNPIPPISVLRDTFIYEDSSGRLISRIDSTSRRAGAYADTNLTGRYRTVHLDGRNYYAHRIIWAMRYGDTKSYIDHIDGNPLNNKIDNLRAATHPLNMCNRPAPPHNTSGEKGVYKRKDNGKFRAYLSVDRKRIWLGTFDTFELAKKEVRKARRKFHGEFAKD